MSYNNVKSIYPQFKCLTTHRKIMKKINTAGKKVQAFDDQLNGQIDVVGMRIYKLMKELKIDTQWYVKSEKHQILNKNSKKKHKVFEKIYGWNKHNENVMDVNYRTEVANYLSGTHRWLAYLKYEEDTTKHRTKIIKQYPFLYKNEDLQEKEEAYADWVKHEMWMSVKKDAFYETMLERDGKGISLCDDVIGLINEYL